MKFYDGRLVEINTLISNTVVNQEPVIETVVEPEPEVEVIENNHLGISNSDLIGRLSNIKDLILLDPYRAQMELEKIISTI